MYRISVPLYNETIKRSGRERMLAELKRFGAERVFLALDCYETEEEKKRNALAELRDNCAFFREQGFEVGAWIWTFWVKHTDRFTKMKTIHGTTVPEFMCPTDQEFVSFAADYVKEIARCGVSLILFDDDFRYGFHSDGTGCLCDNHMARIHALLGETPTREEVYRAIVTGGKNACRDAWLQANGDAFRAFAAAIRAAVDTVDPTVRVGLCACMTLWDTDGTDAREIARLLAGNTKPLVRLIGAPYWAVEKSWGNRLQDVIELERMESSWTRDGEIELMAEGDAYPRPRINCPASFLEGFDTAIRASGCTDGILKYGIDYTSNADYETGYALFHERNRDLYEALDRSFRSAEAVGVRVYESRKKVADAVIPTVVNEQVDVQGLFFSRAARTLAANAVPTVYEGSGVCGIVFDENARALPSEAFEKGLILDAQAAEILTQRGIDVGIEAFGAMIPAVTECFAEDGNRIAADGIAVCDLTLRKGAEVLSTAQTAQGDLPMSFRYENADGKRFLVLNMRTRFGGDNVLRHYARGRQYARAAEWFGEKLPAFCGGHPSLYLQCKRSGDILSVGLWNFSADTAIAPRVELDGDYTLLSLIRCEGTACSGGVVLSDLAPYAFAGFTCKKK